MVWVMSDPRAGTGDWGEALVSNVPPAGTEEEQMECWAWSILRLLQWRLIANYLKNLTWEYMGRPVGVGNPPSSAQTWEEHLGEYYNFHFPSASAYGK